LSGKELSAAQIAQRRAAAHSLHSKVSGRRITAAARAADRARYETLVRDEAAQNGERLRDTEIARKARHKMLQHMQTISRKGVEARKRKAGAFCV
jgi:hypothetical protein